MRTVFLCVAILGTAHVHAQDQGAFEPGQRVRLTVSTMPGPGRLVGTLVSSSAGPVLVQARKHEPPVELRVADVTRIEVSRGRGTAKGAAIGAAIGAVVGAGAIYLSCRSEDDCSMPLAIGVVGGAGLVVGGATGALIGSRERWREVSPIRVALAPRRGRGLSVDVMLSF